MTRSSLFCSLIYNLSVCYHHHHYYYITYIAETNSQKKQEANSTLNNFIQHAKVLENIVKNENSIKVTSSTAPRNKLGLDIPTRRTSNDISNNGNLFYLYVRLKEKKIFL